MNVMLLFVASVIYMTVIFIRSTKLKVIVPGLKGYDVVSYTSSGQLISAFVPGRAGEFVLSTLLKLKYRLEVSRVLPTLLVDKLIELFVVLLFFAIMGMAILKDYLDDFSYSLSVNWMWIAAAIMAITATVIFLYIKVIGRNSKILQIVHNIKAGLILPVKQPKKGLALVILSTAAVAAEYLFLYFVIMAYGVEITYQQIVVVHSIGMLVGIMSMIPGGQGVTEVSMIATFTLWGIHPGDVIAPLLTSKVITYVLLALLSIRILPEVVRIIRQRRKLNS